MTDPVTESCRVVRDRIVQRAGGFEGYFNELEVLDRKRLAAEAAKLKRVKTANRDSAPRVRKRPA